MTQPNPRVPTQRGAQQVRLEDRGLYRQIVEWERHPEPVALKQAEIAQLRRLVDATNSLVAAHPEAARATERMAEHAAAGANRGSEFPFDDPTMKYKWNGNIDAEFRRNQREW